MPDSTPTGGPKRVSRRLRFEIFRRDGHRCKYCGATSDDAELTIDHVVPVALGGTNEASNLVTACRRCNSGKSSTRPDEATVQAVDERAMQWSDAMQLVAERRRMVAAEHDAWVDEFDQEWRSWTVGGEVMPRDEGWRSSIERFGSAGLDRNDLLRLLRVAMESNAGFGRVWKYFCGCCWNEVKSRQEEARALLSHPQVEDEDESSGRDDEIYRSGFDDGYDYAQRYGNRVPETERESIAYETGWREATDRMLRKWRDEHPEDFGTQITEFADMAVDFVDRMAGRASRGIDG